MLAAVSLSLWLRLRIVERDLRRLIATTHEAGNNAIKRHGRDQWRWRQTDWALRTIARETGLRGLDVPDIVKGPPDDPSDDPKV